MPTFCAECSTPNQCADNNNCINRNCESHNTRLSYSVNALNQTLSFRAPFPVTYMGGGKFKSDEGKEYNVEQLLALAEGKPVTYVEDVASGISEIQNDLRKGNCVITLYRHQAEAILSALGVSQCPTQ